MQFTNTDSFLSIRFPGFNISQSATPHYSQNTKHISCAIKSNLEFSSSIVKENALHIIFAQDQSGSMSQFVSGAYKSRLEICKAALRDSVKFLSSLGDEGKTVYVSIILFSFSSTTVVNAVKINSSTLNKVLEKINEIQATDTTDIGSAIQEIKKQIHKTESLNIDRTIKILLSDGYVTSGISSLDLQNNCSEYFDSTIGIGKETEYDKELLLKLTQETDERSCIRESELNSHIVDSVFGKLSILGTQLVINGNLTTSNLEIKDKTIEKESVSLNTYIFLKYIGNESLAITIDNVSADALLDKFKKENNPKERIDFILLSPDYVTNSDSCFVEYLYREENDSFTINIVVTRGMAGKNNKTMCKIIDDFICIANMFKNIDFSQPDKKLYNMVLDKINTLKDVYIDNLEFTNDFIDYISLVLSEYTNSIKPLLEVVSSNGYSMDAFRSASAPVRMCSVQSARSDFAFMGRLASISYSQNSPFSEDSLGLNHKTPSPEPNGYPYTPLKTTKYCNAQN